MKKRTILFFVATLCLILLSACGTKKEDTQSLRTSRTTKKTVGAIKAEDTNVIKLHDGNITLPIDYRYSVSSNDDLTAYFVFNPDECNRIADERDGRTEGEYEALLKESWEKAKEEALKKVKGNEEALQNEELKGEFVFDTDAYITPYHENVSMIIYEGIDRTTPNNELTNSQMNTSFYSYFQTSIMANLTVRNTAKDFGVPYPKTGVDVEKVPEMNKFLYNEKLNGKYYVYTVFTYSGDYMTTTYGIQCFPHTYYGIFLMEKNAFDGSFRRWYAFIFCNDSKGNIFSENDYNDMMKQIKSTFKIEMFPTSQYNKEAVNYDETKDRRNGLSYEQLLNAFTLTSQYHTMYENQTRNLDELTEEEVKKDDSITEVKFD